MRLGKIRIGQFGLPFPVRLFPENGSLLQQQLQRIIPGTTVTSTGTTQPTTFASGFVQGFPVGREGPGITTTAPEFVEAEIARREILMRRRAPLTAQGIPYTFPDIREVDWCARKFHYYAVAQARRSLILNRLYANRITRDQAVNDPEYKADIERYNEAVKRCRLQRNQRIRSM